MAETENGKQVTLHKSRETKSTVRYDAIFRGQSTKSRQSAVGVWRV